MRDEKEGRKKQARSNKQQFKAKPHSTPKAVTFPKKNELPRVGLEPTTLYTLDRVLYQLSSLVPRPICGRGKNKSAWERGYQLSYRGSSAGWAQISHLIVCVYTCACLDGRAFCFECGVSWVIFLSKSDYLGCAVLLCLVVCLTLLAPFLNSVIVIINVHVHCYCDCIHVYMCCVCCVQCMLCCVSSVPHVAVSSMWLSVSTSHDCHVTCGLRVM